MKIQNKKCDAVFEGGGVRGIAFTGAVHYLESRGYYFNNVAGTSAGAIIASLLASGYSGKELSDIICNIPYDEFRDKSTMDKLPLIGPFVSLVFDKGIYEGEFFEQWIKDKLADKGIHTFADLKNGEDYRFQCIATDITAQRRVILPQDSVYYGIQPDKLSVAKAVRMSMSIPYFFEPVIINDNYIVDGAIASNYPVWLFDSPQSPRWPTFGFRLVGNGNGKPNQIDGPVTFGLAILNTMFEASIDKDIGSNDWARTIEIDTYDVGTTEFDIKPDRICMLYNSGRKAAELFLNKWNFERYKRVWR